jgi:porin
MLSLVSAGSGFLRKRAQDRACVGYFHYFFSDALKRGLESTIGFQLGDEQGMQAFYNFALTRWFRIAADLQVVEPGNRSFSTEV